MNDLVYKILDVARHAPSVHNIQPWHVIIDGDSIVVVNDPENALDAGDQSGRQLWISLGIFVQYIVMATQSYGIDAKITYENFPANMTTVNKVAEISIAPGKKLPANNRLRNALIDRHSCRLPYSSKRLDDKTTVAVKDINRTVGMKSVLIDSQKSVEAIAVIHGTAIKMALNMPEFRQELGELIVNKHKNRGLQIKSLTSNFIESTAERIRMSTGKFLGANEKREIESFSNSAALIAIFSKGDVNKDWFRAGQHYAKVIAKLSELGLSHATTAGPVEALDFHEDIEKQYAKSMRLQSVIRIGYVDCNHKLTPRISLDELVVN